MPPMLRAFSKRRLSSYLDHIEDEQKYENTGGLVPVNFKLREEHKPFSLQEKDFTNLLEVVQTPREHQV